MNNIVLSFIIIMIWSILNWLKSNNQLFWPLVLFLHFDRVTVAWGACSSTGDEPPPSARRHRRHFWGRTRTRPREIWGAFLRVFGDDTLWWTNIPMENQWTSPCFMGTSTIIKWPFSTATLNYQRVWIRESPTTPIGILPSYLCIL